MIRATDSIQNSATQFRRLMLIISAILLICIVIVWFVFSNFLRHYKENIVEESAAHLTEIIFQTKLYMEEKIDNDWQVMSSIINSISIYSQTDMTDIFALLQKERDIWGITDILVYAENGYCVSAEQRVYPNDDASDVIYNARKYGRTMDIIQSTITYTMPVETKLTLNDYPIVAVSVTQDLDHFVDNMDFTSFGGEAYIYLAQQNGAVISRSSHPKASSAYNVLALYDSGAQYCLTHKNHTLQEAFNDTDPCTFLIPTADGDQYAVTVPVQTLGTDLWLMYLAPEVVVNQTMNGFSNYVLTLSIASIAVFAICAMSAFIYIYRVRKRAFDTALIARDRMFDLLVSNTSNAFAMLTVNKREPVYMSSNAGKIIGAPYLWLEKTELGYRVHTDSGEDNDVSRQINADIASWDGASEFVSSFVPYHVGGQARYYVLRIYPVEDNESEFIAIVQDVTREREREAALRDALVMANSANNAKTRFLANMSHDIRTPMNAIVNMVSFARESAGEYDKQMEYLQTIDDSAQHLLQLINDILDMSRIESGENVIAADPFDLRKCLDAISDMVLPLCVEKHLSFETNFEDISSNRLRGDHLKLTQVLINLLNNAVKFTPAGGHVRFIAMEMHSLKEETASLRFTVQDDGIGIARENQRRIFEPFARIDEDSIRNIEGTGLGLSICQSYITAMGGSLTCQSELGEGSTFTVELPFTRDMTHMPDIPAHAETGDISFDGKRALLCEDNEVNQDIAGMILKRMGFAVDCAFDGKEGLELFLSSPPNTYDVIYMDIQMPVMNGYAATVAIRESEHPQAKTIPIIAMTANVFTEDVEKARNAGMNEHIGKPIIVSELMQATRRALQS